MKKTIFAFTATLLVFTAVFANSEPTKKVVVKMNNQTTEKKDANNSKNFENDNVCTITCSVVANGVTYTTSSGNWFTGCERAGNDCLVKIAKLSFQAVD